MRILVVTRESPEDRKYGLGKAIGRISEGLSARGHEVRYFSKEDCSKAHRQFGPRLNKLLHSLGDMGQPLAERLIQGACSANAAHSMQATHIWFHDPWLVAGFRLRNLLRGRISSPKPKIVISEHGLGSFAWAVMQDGLTIPQRLFRLLLGHERRVLMGADRVLFPSRAAMSWALRDLQLTTLPTHFTALGYGRPEINPVPKSEARKDLGLSEDTAVILAMGRIAPVKRYEIILQAMKRLEGVYTLPVRLIIAGDGDQNTCLFHEPPLSQPPLVMPAKNVDIWLAAADIYVSACAAESFGMANHEALCAGLPSIVACGGATCETLGHGAWMIPPDAESMALALHTLLTQPDTAAYWRRQAISVAEHWAEWDDIIDAYERILLST